MFIFWTFLMIPHNGKLCDPLVYFLKKKDGAACRFSARQYSNTGCLHHCRQKIME